MWNDPENGYVECGVERWCEIWWRTVMWNAPEKGYVKCGGEL